MLVITNHRSYSDKPVFDDDFDVSYNRAVSGMLYKVFVYKVGGGTVGKRYEGDWYVKILDTGSTTVSIILKTSLVSVSTPFEHIEIASLAASTIDRFFEERQIS